MKRLLLLASGVAALWWLERWAFGYRYDPYNDPIPESKIKLPVA